MTITTETIDETRLEAFIEQMVADVSAAQSAVTTHLGDRLGLYRHLAGAGPTTAEEVAAATGTNLRLVREWLRGQVAGGYLTFEGDTFTLPPEHAMVLADDTSPVFMTAILDIVASMWADTDRVIDAFQGDGRLDWGDHDHRLYDGVARSFGPIYEANLVDVWLPELDGVVEKLAAGGRVADVGCGNGNSVVTMARAFPDADILGIDRHGPSIETARTRAAESGASGARFDVADASELAESDFDLVCFFDCLHDMGDPQAALEAARRALAADGSVMIVEPRSSDDLAENQNPVSRLFYASSLFLCTPGALAQDGPEALGAQAGPSAILRLLGAAGFGDARVVSEGPMNTIFEAKI